LRLVPFAKRYARALLKSAEERGKIEEVFQEINFFSKLFQENSRLRAYLITPEVDKRAKMKIVSDLLQNKTSDLFLNFIRLLILKNRQVYFIEIAQQFTQLYNQKMHRVKAKIISVIPLGDEILTEIKRYLSASLKADIMLENRIDADILGGFIIDIEGKAIDASLRQQLNDLRARLMKKVIAA